MSRKRNDLRVPIPSRTTTRTSPTAFWDDVCEANREDLWDHADLPHGNQTLPRAIYRFSISTITGADEQTVFLSDLQALPRAQRPGWETVRDLAPLGCLLRELFRSAIPGTIAADLSDWDRLALAVPFVVAHLNSFHTADQADQTVRQDLPPLPVLTETAANTLVRVLTKERDENSVPVDRKPPPVDLTSHLRALHLLLIKLHAVVVVVGGWLDPTRPYLALCPGLWDATSLGGKPNAVAILVDQEVAIVSLRPRDPHQPCILGSQPAFAHTPGLDHLASVVSYPRHRLVAKTLARAFGEVAKSVAARQPGTPRNLREQANAVGLAVNFLHAQSATEGWHAHLLMSLAAHLWNGLVPALLCGGLDSCTSRQQNLLWTAIVVAFVHLRHQMHGSLSRTIEALQVSRRTMQQPAPLWLMHPPRPGSISTQDSTLVHGMLIRTWLVSVGMLLRSPLSLIAGAADGSLCLLEVLGTYFSSLPRSVWAEIFRQGAFDCVLRVRECIRAAHLPLLPAIAVPAANPVHASEKAAPTAAKEGAGVWVPFLSEPGANGGLPSTVLDAHVLDRVQRLPARPPGSVLHALTLLVAGDFQGCTERPLDAPDSTVGMTAQPTGSHPQSTCAGAAGGCAPFAQTSVARTVSWVTVGCWAPVAEEEKYGAPADLPPAAFLVHHARAELPWWRQGTDHAQPGPVPAGQTTEIMAEVRARLVGLQPRDALRWAVAAPCAPDAGACRRAGKLVQLAAQVLGGPLLLAQRPRSTTQASSAQLDLSGPDLMARLATGIERLQIRPSDPSSTGEEVLSPPAPAGSFPLQWPELLMAAQRLTETGPREPWSGPAAPEDSDEAQPSRVAKRPATRTTTPAGPGSHVDLTGSVRPALRLGPAWVCTPAGVREKIDMDRAESVEPATACSHCARHTVLALVLGQLALPLAPGPEAHTWSPPLATSVVVANDHLYHTTEWERSEEKGREASWHAWEDYPRLWIKDHPSLPTSRHLLPVDDQVVFQNHPSLEARCPVPLATLTDHQLAQILHPVLVHPGKLRRGTRWVDTDLVVDMEGHCYELVAGHDFPHFASVEQQQPGHMNPIDQRAVEVLMSKLDGLVVPGALP
jgi:hypothetical protein